MVSTTGCRRGGGGAIEHPAASLLEHGEHAEDWTYEDLLARVAAAARPAGALEQGWVRDVTDLTWEMLRLHRLRWSLMKSEAHRGLERMRPPLREADCTPPGPQAGAEAATPVRDLATCADRPGPGAATTIDRILADAGLAADAVMAQTLAGQIGEIERMISVAEIRRSEVLGRIRRNRDRQGAMNRPPQDAPAMS